MSEYRSNLTGGTESHHRGLIGTNVESIEGQPLSDSKQFSFGVASQSRLLSSSSNNSNSNSHIGLNAMKPFTATSEKEKEEKLSRIREMEERMRQLQQEKQSIHAVVNERGERAALIESNSKLKEYITSLEQQLRSKDSFPSPPQYTMHADGTIEDRVSQLMRENSELVEHMKSAQHELGLLVQQKEVDLQIRSGMEEKLISAERVNEMLEERLSALRDEMIQVQFASSRDGESVSELKAAYSKLNSQLDLELKNKKTLESQLVAARASADRIKSLENECRQLENTQERLKAQLKEQSAENLQLKQQYLAENQKALTLEKASLKVYQVSKEFEVSQTHLKEVQLTLAASEKNLHERDQKVAESTQKLRETQNLLELRQQEEKSLREQLNRAAEKRATLEKELSAAESSVLEKDQLILKAKRDIDALQSTISDLQARLSNEIANSKESRAKEHAAIRESERLSEEMNLKQTALEHLQEKLVKQTKQVQRDAEDSQLMLEEIRAQSAGDLLGVSTRLSQVQAQLSELQSTHDALVVDHAETEKSFSKTKQKLDSEHAALRAYETQCEQKDEAIKALTEQLNDLHAREARQGEQLAKLASQTKQFTAEKENSLREMQKLTEVKIKLADRQIGQKEAELQMNLQIVDEYQQQIVRLQAQLVLFDQTQEELSATEESLRESEQRIDSLERTAIEREKLLKEFESERIRLAERVTRYEAELVVAKESEKAMKQTERHLREEKHTMKINFDALNEESKLMAIQLRDASAKINAYEIETSLTTTMQRERQKEELTVQIETLKVKLETQATLSAQREEELATATKDVADLSRSIKQSNKRIQSLQDELEAAKEEAACLKVKLTSMQSKSNSGLAAGFEQAELETQLTFLRNKEKKHIETIANLQTEVSRLEILAEDLAFSKKTVELQLAKSTISLSQQTAAQNASEDILELEQKIAELLAKNRALEQQISQDPKIKLYEKYALPFDPLHPGYAASTLKKTQSQAQLGNTIFPQQQSQYTQKQQQQINSTAYQQQQQQQSHNPHHSLMTPLSPRKSRPLPMTSSYSNSHQQQQQQYPQFSSPNKQHQQQQPLNSQLMRIEDQNQKHSFNNNALFPNNNSLASSHNSSNSFNNGTNYSNVYRNNQAYPTSFGQNQNNGPENEDMRILRHVQELTRMY